MPPKPADRWPDKPPTLWITFLRQSVACATMLLFGLGISIFTLPNSAHSQLTSPGAEQVSIGLGGVQPAAGKPNSSPAVPLNGSFVLFASLAQNLTSDTLYPNTSPTYNVYLRNRAASTTELISARPDGKAPQKVGGSNNGAELVDGAIEPAVSEVASDGSFAVAFTSDANDLLGDGKYLTPDNSPLGPAQVYIRIYRPIQGYRTFLVSEAKSSNGPFSDEKTGANGRSDQPTIVRYPAPAGSISHRYSVCFRSSAGNFVTAGMGPSMTTTIYCVHGIGFDGTTGEGSFHAGDRFKIAPTNSEPEGATGHGRPQLSRDSSTLAFVSDLDVFVPSPYAAPRKQVYSLPFPPLPSDTPSLLSFRQDGLPAEGNSDQPSLSYDGTFVAFIHTPNLAGANALKGFGIQTLPFFVRHTRGASDYRQINKSGNGQAGDGGALSGRLDDSGRYAVFSDNSPVLSSSMDQTYQVFFKDLEATAEDPDGPLIMVSQRSAGIVGDRDSGKHPNSDLITNVAINSFSENSTRVFMTAFTSIATNLNSIGTPSESAPFIFRSLVYGTFDDPPPSNPTSTPTPAATSTPTPQASPTQTPSTPPSTAAPIVDEPQLLVPNAPITEPPRIEVQPTNGGKRFDITIFCQLFTLDPSLGSKAEFLALAAAGARLTYAVEIRKAGSRQRITRSSSKNVVTVRKLEPGRYTVRYRVSAKVGKKTIKSRTSPATTIVLS